jgi:transposase-like protein
MRRGVCVTYQISREVRIRIAVYALELEPDLTVARAAKRVGVRHAEVTKAWRAYGSGPRVDEAEAAKVEPFASLCDEVAEVLSARPQSARQIFARLPRYGERRLYRVLRRLIDTNRAVKRVIDCHECEYTRGVA